MDWTKIPTNLIIKRFSDYEIASIVKFQLVWAINEEQPDKNTCLRYMTAKQYETAMTYLDSISARVNDDVSSVVRKRNAEKLRYNKNKDLNKNLQADCKQSGNSLPEQIRLDKIREDNIKEKITKKESKPTLEEVKQYCEERGNLIDPNEWFDYYSANGWKVGKNTMKDWKACVRYWEQKRKGTKTIQEEPAEDYETRKRAFFEKLGVQI